VNLPRDLKIGDVLPLGDVDPIAARAARYRRGSLQRAAEGIDERAAREACPVEQAKAVLRRAGFRVFAAEVSGGPQGQFYVGTMLCSADEVLVLAEKRGWRRAA
jgi:hypothetical protein